MLHWVTRLSRNQVLLLSLLLLLVIGLLDTRTDYEFDLGVLYLAPILLVTWTAGRRFGWAATVMSASLQTLADIVTGKPVSHSSVHIWAFVANVIVFGVLVELTVRLNNSFAAEYALARRDRLTHLCNQIGFYELAERELARSRREYAPLTLLYLDCDGFKVVNDTHGHQAGDRVLGAIGDALHGAMRSTDVAARLGGDEFVLLLPGVAALEAPSLAERIVTVLCEAMDVDGWRVTFSIGAISFAYAPESVDALLAPADALMYTVKDAGKNGIAYAVVP